MRESRQCVHRMENLHVIWELLSAIRCGETPTCIIYEPEGNNQSVDITRACVCCADSSWEHCLTQQLSILSPALTSALLHTALCSLNTGANIFTSSSLPTWSRCNLTEIGATWVAGCCSGKCRVLVRMEWSSSHLQLILQNLHLPLVEFVQMVTLQYLSSKYLFRLLYTGY